MSERLWRKNLINIEPYVAGEQPDSEDIIKLNANENPYPPSPMVQKVISEFDTEELKKYPSEDIYIIGGDTIYRQFLPYCDVAHVTRTDHAYDADAWFPNLDEDPDWELTGQSGEKTYFDLEFTFCRYERKKKDF